MLGRQGALVWRSANKLGVRNTESLVLQGIRGGDEWDAVFVIISAQALVKAMDVSEMSWGRQNTWAEKRMKAPNRGRATSKGWERRRNPQRWKRTVRKLRGSGRSDVIETKEVLRRTRSTVTNSQRGRGRWRRTRALWIWRGGDHG